MRDRIAAYQHATTRYLLWSGAIGPLLFVCIFLIEGAILPGYNPWRTTISTLSLSEQGWTQIANFTLFGLSTLCFAMGLRRVFKRGFACLLAPALFAVVGIGLILAGLFVTDPALGYPVHAPANLQESLHGTIHNLAALVIFLTVPAICFVIGRRFSRYPAWKAWSTLSKVAGGLILIFFGWFFTSVSSSANALTGDVVHAGLLERITSIIGCLWMSALAFRLVRRLRPVRCRRLRVIGTFPYCRRTGR